jgi:hypothetical protein
MATLALILCGDGVNRCKPLIIFRGGGKTAALKNEMKYYDPRSERGRTPSVNRTPVQRSGGSRRPRSNPPRLLTVDTCPTHRIMAVLQHLSSAEVDATVALIPEGLTGNLQPLDTHISKSVRQHTSAIISRKR